MVEAIVRLEVAYSSYLTATIANEGIKVASLELAAARRSYSRAVGLIDHSFARNRAEAYADQLETHYLFYEAGPDEIPEGRDVPTSAALEKSNGALITALNHYEST
ncbi:hypothetical protein SEA_PHISHY_34 [Gordonia phage Phishy]|nr:hypothetical protein SEA_PHISHY_34 [Gordonia phage Phishy]